VKSPNKNGILFTFNILAMKTQYNLLYPENLYHLLTKTDSDSSCNTSTLTWTLHLSFGCVSKSHGQAIKKLHLLY
jgi:hypothetical protein